MQPCISLICKEGYLLFKNCPILYIKRNIYILKKYITSFHSPRKAIFIDALRKLRKWTIKVGLTLLTEALIGMTQALTKPCRKGTSPPPFNTAWILKRQMCILESIFWIHPGDLCEAGQWLVSHSNQEHWSAKKKAEFQFSMSLNLLGFSFPGD